MAEAEASAGLTVEVVDVAALEVAEVARGVVVVVSASAVSRSVG